MRRLIPALAFALALPVWAQQKPKLEPLPEPPPPPPGYQLDPALEPQVTIVKRGEDVVEEYRIAGRLYMLKVTPPNGTPYYLVDEQGHGNFVRHETLSPQVRVPMWVIKSW